MGIKIENATTTLDASTSNLADHFIPLGITGGSSINILISEIATYIQDSGLTDRIVEGSTKVEVIDTAGVDLITFTIENNIVINIDDSGIHPANNGDANLGNNNYKWGNLYLSKGIVLGSDATGDMYYRDASANLTRIPIVINDSYVLGQVSGVPTWKAETGGGTSGDSRWTTWTGCSYIADGTIANATHILPHGTPVRFKTGSGGTWRYAIVDSGTSGTHIMKGYLYTSADDIFEYGTPELVHTEVIQVNGEFANQDLTVSATSGLLYDNSLMKYHYKWNKATAYLAAVKATCFISDSSSPPTIQTQIDNGSGYVTPFNTQSVSSTEITTSSSAASTNYKLDYGATLDFEIEEGNNGDASDITIFLMFIQS